jgi:Mg2+ and Co2+ transporter CorA
MRFKEILDRARGLDTAINALAQMASNLQQLKEARSTKTLTVVGLVFIPLAYTASLFSMASPYGPGYSQFWLYFIISIPLAAIVYLAYRMKTRESPYKVPTEHPHRAKSQDHNHNHDPHD